MISVVGKMSKLDGSRAARREGPFLSNFIHQQPEFGASSIARMHIFLTRDAKSFVKK